MERPNSKELAKLLHDARLEKVKRPYLTKDHQLSIENAYEILYAGIQLRSEAGEKYRGMKMGLTSKAKREQMDLDSPCFGVLTDRMELSPGGQFSLKDNIHPKIEPEVAFTITSPLSTKASRDEIIAAIDGVYPALEILDTRYEAFKYFSLEDVVADNCSSSHFVLGEKKTSLEDLQVDNLKMEMKINGEVAQSGNSSAISEDPINSVVQLLEMLNKSGRELPVPCVILTGAATAAVTLEAGMQVELSVEKLGSVSLNISE